MKKTIMIIFALIAVSQAYTQIIVSGKITDSANAPIEFTNIVLLQNADSAFVAGTATDSLGNFSLNVAENSYLLKASMLGYKPYFQNISAGNIGTITLQADTMILGEVVVQGVRPIYKMESGGVSTDVQNSFLAKLGTAQDVLAQLPFVNVVKNEISVFGKGKPIIYLNNRLLRDMSELEQLNSNQIKKVTVITNPGAEYDATVQSVIRIETIKRQGEGLSGNFMSRLTVDKRFSHNETLNLNYRKGSLDLFGMMRYRKYGDLQLLELQQKTRSNSTETSVTQAGEQEHKSQSIRANIGANYTFTAEHSAGVKFQSSRTLSNSFVLPSDFTALKNNVLDESFASKITADDYKCPFSNYLNGYYEGQFTTWLAAKLNFDYATGKDGNYRLSENFRQNITETIETQDDSNYDLYAAKLIFTSPLWEGQLNYGYEFSKTTNNQHFNILQKGNSNILNSSQNTAKQWLNAAFATYARQFGNFSAEISFRYENIDFQYFNGEIKEEEPSKTYNNFFPSASVAYQTGNVQMQFAYRNSTLRPSYYQLRSEMQYDNPYTYEAGNPYLKPTIINTLSYMFVWKNLQTQIAYNLFKDRMISPPYLLTDDIICMQPINLNKSQTFTFTAAYAPTIKFWNPNLEFDFIKDFLTYDAPAMTYNKPLIIIGFSNNFRLPKDLNFSANLTYQSNGHSDMMYSHSNYRFDIVVSKNMLNNNLRLNLGAEDIFGTYKQRVVDVTNYISTSIWKDRNTRCVYLSISYDFNATKNKYRGEQASDELNRL
jgi:hypothetical protein